MPIDLEVLMLITCGSHWYTVPYGWQRGNPNIKLKNVHSTRYISDFGSVGATAEISFEQTGQKRQVDFFFFLQ